jgi:hypothetical protein
MNAIVKFANARETAIMAAETSTGAGRYASLIADLVKARQNVSGVSEGKAVLRSSASIEDRLADRLLTFKTMISPISRYLEPNWRADLFAALDRLFDVDDWDEDFALPEVASFATFLRLILHLHPTKRPGLGLSARGHILASWSKDRDRIVIECLSKDDLRWVISQSIAGSRESAAGKNRIHRLIDLIEGYEPDRFFKNGDETIA